MAGLGADDLGLLEDAQDDEDKVAASGYRAPAPKRARASADDIAMFGAPGAAAPAAPKAPAPVATGGASAEDIAMFGASPAKPEATQLAPDDIDEAGQVVGKPGLLDRAKESFSNFGRTIAKAVPAAIDLASPLSREPSGYQVLGVDIPKPKVPFSQLSDPSYRRELERGVSDTVTGGLATKIANKVDPSFAATEAEDAARNPDVRTLGGMGGLALPSPFTWAGRQAAGIIPGTGPLAATARNVAAYEGMAVPQAAVSGALNAPAGHRLEAAQEAASEAATDPSGLALSAVPLALHGAARGNKRIAGGAVERDITRALADIEEGATKKTKAGLRAANPEAAEVLKESPDVRANITSHSTPKTDAKLNEASEFVSRRAAKALESIYETADVDSVRPAKKEPPPSPAPKEYKLTDRDIMEAESVPEHVDPEMSGMGTRRIENPNFPTRPESPDIGETIPRGRARIIPDDSALPGEPPPAAGPRTKLPGPGGSAGDSELLFVNARAAEAEAAKLAAKAERYARQAEGFVNPELSAKASKRASIAEIAADEAKQRAANLRDQAETIESRGGPPPGMPPGSPFAEVKPAKVEPAVEPVQRKPGVQTDDAAANMSRTIARLMKGTSEERAVAKQLEIIRDEFQAAHGDGAVIPSKQLRAEQSAYQKKGYGKGMPGDEAASARIAANRLASMDVGDVVIKHVTGMDYEQARAAAKADPKSVAGRLMRANDDIMVANRIQALTQSRAGANLGAPHRLTALIGGLKHSAATAAVGSTLGATAGALYGGGVTAMKALPYVRRGIDAAAVRAAPILDRAAASAPTANPAAIARLIQAGKAGASRVQLQAQAEEEGVPPEIAERLINAKGLDTKFKISGGAAGMVEPGNVDLTNRPDVANADGTHSSVRSMSFEEGGQEILVPTVSEDGRIMSDDEAIAQYHKTGRHLGKFRSPREATAYASRLHDQQEAQGPR